MKAKLVKESLNASKGDYKDTFDAENSKYTLRKLRPGENAEDIKKIEAFAKENGYEFGMNKNKTPYISLRVYYPMVLSYDQLRWAAIVKEIRYTFTYTNWETPISLRKVWYGLDSNDTVKNWYETDPWYLQSFTAIQGWKTIEQQIEAFSKYVEDNPNKLNSKPLKQNLMGRFRDIETALKRVKLNIEKEKSKQNKR